MTEQDKDLRDVYEAEARRGRRPVDIERKREEEKFKQGMRKAIREKDERAFLTVLREAGVMDGTDEFATAVRLFRDQIGRR